MTDSAKGQGNEGGSRARAPETPLTSKSTPPSLHILISVVNNQHM